MIFSDLGIDVATFEQGAGWKIKPEGACLGDVCVPLPESEHGFDVVAVAERLGMALVHDPTRELWALGPASIGGRGLATRAGRGPGTPCIRRHDLSTVLVAWPKSGARGMGAVLRVRLRPARVAGTARSSSIPVWRSSRFASRSPVSTTLGAT